MTTHSYTVSPLHHSSIALCKLIEVSIPVNKTEAPYRTEAAAILLPMFKCPGRAGCFMTLNGI
jgi:hypothetical protein